MKECKVIHINDGVANVIQNGDRHFVEEFPWTDNFLNNYLAQGYEVKHIMPNITPNILEKGCYPFFIGGFTVYLEKEDECCLAAYLNVTKT